MGKKVYAGFWKRLGAGIVDLFVSIPFLITFDYLESFSLTTAILTVMLSSVFFSVYTIYFHL